MGGSCTAGSSLLKAWLSWFRGGVLLRLFGLPCALLALHLEIYGSSPTTTTLILHRLSRRLRLSTFVCMFRKGHASTKVNSFFFFLGGADVMDCVVAPLSPEPSSPTSPRSPRSPRSLRRLSQQQRSSPRAAGRRRRSTHSLHKDQTTQTQPSPEQSGGDFRPQSPQPLPPQTPPALPQTPAQPPRPHSVPVPVSQSHHHAAPSQPPPKAALPPPPPSPPAPPTPSPPPSQPLPKPHTAAAAAAAEAQPKVHTEPQPKLHTAPQSKVHTPEPQPTLPSEEPQPKLHSEPQPKPHIIHVQAQAPAQAPAQAQPKPQPLPQIKQPLRTPRRPLPTPLPLSVATGSASSAVSSRSRPSPSSSTLSPSLSASLIMNSHARSKSHADVVNQGKRLSLQFPIQPSAGTNSPGFSPRNSPHNSRPQSWVATPSSAVTSPDVVPSPTEHNFLAILAAQERYVLELKEELAKAEEDLKTVKKHWATHQSVKQRNEHRKITQLQTLSATFPTIRPDQDDEDGSTMWMQKEMERRKALLCGQRTSQRKVFSGSRHLRTLSLLSPDKTYAPSFPQPADLRDPSPELPTRPQALARTATSPEIAQQIADQMKDDRYDLSALSNIQRDQLLRTGKRMATDFKDGLLTFIEDIRQATVGDEALDNEDQSLSSATKSASVNGTRKTSTGRPALARTGSSKSTPRQSDDIADDFWKEHGLSEPKTAPTQKKTHPVKQNRTPQKPTKEEDFEEWDNWDTPNDKHNDHAAAESDSDESSAPSSPVSGQASSRTSTRYHSKRHDSKASSLTTNSSSGFDDAVLRDAKRNSIPWPDLVKLSPGNLKRTASHLMKEWEKNLTPPPESREGGHQSGDYIGRSASPAGWP